MGPVIMPHRVMTSRRRRNYTVKAVSGTEVDKFSGVAQRYFFLSCGNVYVENNTRMKFCHLTLGVPLCPTVYIDKH